MDLIVYSDGSIKVDDRDELDAAYEDGDISEEQYNRAIYTAETLEQGLLKDYGEYQSFVSDRLKLVEKCLRTL